MLISRDHCHVCQGTYFVPHAELGHRRIVRCKACGYTFADRYDTDALAEHYRSGYYASPDDPRIQQWIDQHMDIWRGTAADLAALGQPLASLLDIGAGTGGFLLAVRERFPQLRLTACESSSEAKENLRRRLPDLTFTVDDADRLAEADDSFDCITLLQCLEHVAEPQELCRQIHARLNPGGVLLLTVPNRHSYEVLGGHRDTSLCYANPTHLQFFDRWSLRRMLRQAGFARYRRVVSLGGGPHRGLKQAAQYACRRLGISTELRALAWKQD